ncbi:hypothetical protein PILCRDRAFT_491430 [Piloderma croceum F 1598]|uniref:Aminoglycoside phosphotransferase domain-containing protein n=1 Tax=Piloderma croceum (strain F 1598) TaxID=765440 RepID=A0A0C3FAY5_PILCF|nr:hypothetical protein PILCRDRAFT_491430 [Piloderma croceum F 1598]
MFAMNLVRSQTTIPVPCVRRVINHVHPDGTGLIAIDCIRNGKQLHACWPSLSLWAKLKVILTVRFYLRQLRQIQDVHSSTPGPLGPHPSSCKGLQFGLDSKGPFLTTATLAEHFHEELRRAEDRYFRGRKSLDGSIFARFVFTHNDLNMRNILLDDEGRLGLGLVWLLPYGL